MRTTDTYRKNAYSLDSLFQKFHDAKTAEGLADSTLDKYELYYGYFCAFLNERDIPRDIRKITPDVIRAYSAWMIRDKVRFTDHKFKPASEKTEGLAPRTVNDRLKFLRIFFKFLVSEGETETNPIKNVKDVRVKHEEIDIMTPDEVRAIMLVPDQRRYADFRDYVLMNVMLESFTRIKETLSIRGQDVNHTGKYVHIRADYAKNRRSRDLPLSNRTLRLLKDQEKETDDFDEDRLFLSNYGAPLTPDHFRQRLKKYAKQAGVKKRIHPHLFRHTAATWALEDGMESEYLRHLLGHVDERSMQIYLHLSRRSIAEQHAQYTPLNRVYGKLNKPRKLKR